MKILVLGIGSPIMCDDAIGLRVLEELKTMELEGVDLQDACCSGFDLIEVMMDYDKVILIDAIIDSGYPPGTVMELCADAFADTVHGSNPHEANIGTTIELGKKLEPERFPKEFYFVAVEANDVATVSEHMTPEVEAALPEAVKTVLKLIGA
ncbi:MAG: hydrogenase maturation protease [Euryarchaeota archaeon]|nr:hydrogenase maturation protease [Euryarchaeota archaeon]